VVLVARKPEQILRALEELPQESLKVIKAFIDSLKERNGEIRASGRNGSVLAKKQLSVIKKWAGTTLKAGFSGREHDAVLYRKNL
jgi:hypothetical protein